MPSQEHVLGKVIGRSTSDDTCCDCGCGLVLQEGGACGGPRLRWSLRWSATAVRASMTTVVPGATALLGMNTAAAWLPATAATARNAPAGRDPTAGRAQTPPFGVLRGPLMYFSMVASRTSTPLARSRDGRCRLPVSNDCGWNSGLGGNCGDGCGSALCIEPVCLHISSR